MGIRGKRHNGGAVSLIARTRPGRAGRGFGVNGPITGDAGLQAISGKVIVGIKDGPSPRDRMGGDTGRGPIPDRETIAARHSGSGRDDRHIVTQILPKWAPLS